MTDRRSFDNINKWMGQISSFAPSDVRIMLVGNKTDLEGERVISTEEGKKMADKYEIPYFESSAKTGYNITEIFQEIGRLLLEKAKKNPVTVVETTQPTVTGQNTNNILIKKKKNCC